MDTSAIVAALVADHEHHTVTRPHLAKVTSLPAIVLAEAFSQFRRTFGQNASTATSLLAHWTADPTRVLTTTPSAVATVFARATELDLGGNIHDALIAEVCREHGAPLMTLDVRQHRLALALGASSTYLLA
ncbi:MAG: PIN domain-containing protein [Acidimicrobiales bacterium]